MVLHTHSALVLHIANVLFRFATMIHSVGLSWSSSIAYSMIILLGILPTILLHVKGKHWR